MRILYVDLISSRGHIGFNNIYVKALNTIKNATIHIAFKENYSKNIKSLVENKIFNIPQKYFNYSNSWYKHIYNRWLITMAQLYVKRNINLHEYDLILLASFDNFSMLFTRFPKTTALISHNNVRQAFNSKLHLICLRYLSNRYKVCVFNIDSKNFAKNKKVRNIFFIPHGLREKFVSDNTDKNKDKKTVIFSPNMASINTKLYDEIISSNALFGVLKEKNAELVMKYKNQPSNSYSIKIIDRYLSEEEYKSYFANADFIFLAYNSNFKFRVSGILLEAISNNKPLIIYDNGCFNWIRDYLSGAVFFNSLTDLIEKIKTLDHIPTVPNYREIHSDYSSEKIAEHIVNKLIC